MEVYPHKGNVYFIVKVCTLCVNIHEGRKQMKNNNRKYIVNSIDKQSELQILKKLYEEMQVLKASLTKSSATGSPPIRSQNNNDEIVRLTKEIKDSKFLLDKKINEAFDYFKAIKDTLNSFDNETSKITQCSSALSDAKNRFLSDVSVIVRTFSGDEAVLPMSAAESHVPAAINSVPAPADSADAAVNRVSVPVDSVPVFDVKADKPLAVEETPLVVEKKNEVFHEMMENKIFDEEFNHSSVVIEALDKTGAENLHDKNSKKHNTGIEEQDDLSIYDEEFDIDESELENMSKEIKMALQKEFGQDVRFAIKEDQTPEIKTTGNDSFEAMGELNDSLTDMDGSDVSSEDTNEAYNGETEDQPNDENDAGDDATLSEEEAKESKEESIKNPNNFVRLSIKDVLEKYSNLK